MMIIIKAFLSGLLLGTITGTVLMFLAIRNGYVKVSKKPKLPRDMEIGAQQKGGLRL